MQTTITITYPDWLISALGFLKKIPRPLLYSLPLLIAVAVYFIVSLNSQDDLEISDAKVTKNGKTESIKLPYTAKMRGGSVFSISYNLSVKDKKTAKFQVIPDDCIQEILINDAKFPLDGIKGLCDYRNGAYFDFSEYVKEGINRFEFRIKNNGSNINPVGLNVVPYSISDITITRNGKTESIKFPYSADMPKGEIFTISYDLQVKDKKTAKFKVIPDNCIQEILINGEEFPLKGIKGLCDYKKGANIDFSEYVNEGVNHFEFRIKNDGDGVNPAGLNVVLYGERGFSI